MEMKAGFFLKILNVQILMVKKMGAIGGYSITDSYGEAGRLPTRWKEHIGRIYFSTEPWLWEEGLFTQLAVLR